MLAPAACWCSVNASPTVDVDNNVCQCLVSVMSSHQMAVVLMETRSHQHAMLNPGNLLPPLQGDCGPSPGCTINAQSVCVTVIGALP